MLGRRHLEEDVAIDFDDGLEPTFSLIAVTYAQVRHIEDGHIPSTYLVLHLRITHNFPERALVNWLGRC